MIKRLVKIGILFDFYGKLLSERQYTAIELYYIHDLSLSEIGEELSISRQGVYDTLRRAENKLYEYEDVLGLVSKFNHNKNEIGMVYKLTDEIKKEAELTGNDKILEKVKKLTVVLEKIMDDSQEVVY
ncbi:MAG: DNA-binding protein [Tissierellia bacterium]|nr:DNA-binding protein [Tissierellia bacterium]